jgi:hypothetical protein
MSLPLPLGRRHYPLTWVAQRADVPRYMTQLAGRKKFLQLIDHDGNTTANEAEYASDREEPHIRNGALSVQRPVTATTGHYDTDSEGDPDLIRYPSRGST